MLCSISAFGHNAIINASNVGKSPERIFPIISKVLYLNFAFVQFSTATPAT